MVTRDPNGYSSLATTTEAEEQVQEELAHHLETLRDLGPAYNDAVAASLLHSIQPLIDERVRQVGQQDQRRPATEHQERRKTPALILGFAIPLSAIVGDTTGLIGIALLWIALFIIAIVVTTQSLPYDR